MVQVRIFVARLSLLAALGCTVKAAAQTDLAITYGSQGIQTLSYRGVVLEDLGTNSSDAFHIWHMKMTDLTGNPATCSQCGWGENKNSRTWNPTTHTFTYIYNWGSIAVQFIQSGNTLDMNVTETNAAKSGLILDGAAIYPFVLNFPQLPVGFNNPSYAQLTFETTGPGVTAANFGSGEVAAVDPDAAKPLYSGFLPAGRDTSYTPLISGTAPDGLAAFLPHNDRPVQPGQTDTFTVSLRFAPSGTAAGTLASDAYRNWAATWPSQLNWTDRRVIGTLYLASSPQGNVNLPAGYPNNPRRYFNDSNPADFDVTNPAGLARFQARILQQAASNVVNLGRLNAQGAITWDVEGDQYPQSTSYVCEPDYIAQAAPEMESVISDSASPYHGMKLDDAYFQIMRAAGFRVGVCVRPQHFSINSDGTAQQTYLTGPAIAAELLRKMQYAHTRWGATLFYVDSTVDLTGAALDAGIFQQLQTALPDSLIIPEETTPKDYAYTAPFQTFIFHGDLGTNPVVYSYYPHAFSAILINDVDPSTLAASQAQLTQSVRNGDLLMTHADYWQANNPTIVQMYADAGVGVPPTPPPPPLPPPPAPVPDPAAKVSITSPVAGAMLSGAISVSAQVNVNLDAANSYLLVDGSEFGTYRASASPFLYPLDTTLLSNGQHTLQIWAHDTANSTDLSAPISITVANSAPAPTPTPTPVPIPPTPPPPPAPAPAPSPTGVIVITSPSNGATLSGKLAVTASIVANLDAAGSYLMVDGVEIGTQRESQPPYLYALDTGLFSDGPHTLQIWGHDTGNNTQLSTPITVTIANGSAPTPTPTPTPTPAPTPEPTPTPTPAPVPSTYSIALTYPTTGQGISGSITVAASIPQQLDAAGSYLMVDGVEIGTQRVGTHPYLYALDTRALTPGQHILQVWAHDTNNDTLLSNPVTVTVGAPGS